MFKRKYCSIKTGLLVLWIILSFFVSQVFAQQNIHFGRFKVEPGMAYKGEFNDNIYSAQNNEEDDYINTVTPSINLSYIEGTIGNFFNIGYSVDLVAYSSNSDNNYQAHKPYIAMGIKTPVGLYLRASDNFLHTKDPYGTENQYKIGDKTERWNNTAEIIAGYDFFERYALELMYKNYAERFDLSTDAWQDRIDDILGVSFFVKLTGKTSVFVQYRQTSAEYDSQNDGAYDKSYDRFWSSSTSQDYNLHDYFAGARFKPGGKLSGEIKLGYGNKKFNNKLDIDERKYEDDGSWIAETTISYQMKERTLFSLNLQKSQKGSPDVDASSYIDTLVGLSLDQDLANRLSFNLGLEWVNNDYLNEESGKADKAFNIYTVKGGLGYKIQDWLKAGLSYEYKSKTASNSDYENSEFNTNILSVSLRAVF